jgi:hypothetical protein
MSDIKILDIFYQSADAGIPSHWCVQLQRDGKSTVDYEYFGTWADANEYAMKYGYND